MRAGWVLLLAACASSSSTRGDPPAPAPSSIAASAAATTAAAAPARVPFVATTDPEVLAPLERLGLELAFGEAHPTTAELGERTAYRDVAEVLADELKRIRAADRRSGEGMSHAHRLFEQAWLRSPETRFELVGVVNRFDRVELYTCGELRFVYRLAYTTTVEGMAVSSRLPMTLNVVMWQGACDPDTWLVPRDLGGAELGRWLAEHPLSHLRRPGGELSSTSGELKSVEINMQTVRWPSAVHPTMAGHAEYLLRVFHRERDRFAPAPLEDVPDVERIRRTPALRAELRALLTDETIATRAAFGRLRLPEKMLARRAVSVAPRGLARLANRPFSQIFDPDDLPATVPGFTSARELLRRLDQLTCQGCHQSRSLAGFHLLGEPRAGDAVDALAVAVSPHLAAELVRRRGHLENGTKVPQQEVAERLGGGWGEHCSLRPDVFPSWTCDEGLSCRAVLGDDAIGACMPASAAAPGDACEPGVVSQDADPHRDRVGEIGQTDCGAGICERNRVGFPGGMCATGCDSTHPEAVCGAIAILTDFNDCLARQEPFERCITSHSRPAGLRRCDARRPCRDDYVCALTPSGGGACIPPYFLFQLRVDGHP
jgi:hypothetical protein